MSRVRKSRVLGAAAAATLFGIMAFPSPASAYVAGTATVNYLGYNSVSGYMEWSCNFSNWAQPAKFWRCEWWDEQRTVVIKSYGSNNWTGLSLTTQRYSNPDPTNPYSYRALAGYNDGSSEASSWRWG